MAACVSYPDLKMLEFPNGEFKASDEDINIGISVQEGNKELVEKLNSALKDLTEDDFNAMMEQAIKVQPLSES